MTKIFRNNMFYNKILDSSFIEIHRREKWRWTLKTRVGETFPREETPRLGRVGSQRMREGQQGTRQEQRPARAQGGALCTRLPGRAGVLAGAGGRRLGSRAGLAVWPWAAVFRSGLLCGVV